MNAILVRNMIVLLCTVVFSVLFVVLPLYVAKPLLGKAILISIPPMLIFTLSWMIPFWKFYNKTAFLVPITLGLMPFRIMLCIIYCYMMLEAIPEINPVYFVGGLMWHWILFAIPEINIMLSTTGQSELESFLILDKSKGDTISE